MRCAPVIVLRASSTVRQGVRQLERIPEDVDVVLVREHDGAVLYYVFSAQTLRTRLSTANPDADLASAIQLGEFQAATAGQLDPGAPIGSVALEGRQVLGVIVDDGGREVRGGGGAPDTTVAPTPPPRVDPYERPVTRGGITVRSLDPRNGADSYLGPPSTRGDSILVSGPPVIVASEAGPPAGPIGLFRAYPDVAAPGQVTAGHEFSLDIGFSKTPPPWTLIQGSPVVVPSGPKAEFVIQVTGFGFSFPDGIQRTLVVDRDDPESTRVQFTVRADSSEVAAPRILEVSYEFAGVVVGRTWAQVQIMAGVPAQPATPAVVGGSGLITEIFPDTSPHLSVDIFSRSGDPELRWRFHCRYPEIERPGEVITTLNDDSAQSFAVQLMRQIPAVQSGPFLAATMQGVGDVVADALPDEFWPIFQEVWQRARAGGDEPRMQITTTEPWIPWELAWIDKERLPQADSLLPPDFKDGAALGQLWQLARWTTPTRQLSSGQIPASPPASKIAANEMAVIIGNYEGAPGIASLPHAVEEGKTIAMSYGALPLSISGTDVASLMGCCLQRDGAAFEPTVIHFAGHGQTDVNNPQFTGLVLKGGSRLDPLVVRGFRLVAKQQPFVFLNACEAGVAGETLTQLGGLVGAFLAEGTRGFVAPLWKVDDVAARDIAVEFYRRTLDDGESVGEAMRHIRRQFTADSTSATALAYVFYGNPDLRLERSAQ